MHWYGARVRVGCRGVRQQVGKPHRRACKAPPRGFEIDGYSHSFYELAQASPRARVYREAADRAMSGDGRTEVGGAEEILLSCLPDSFVRELLVEARALVIDLMQYLDLWMV